MGGSKTAILAQVVHFYSDGWVTLQSVVTPILKHSFRTHF